MHTMTLRTTIAGHDIEMMDNLPDPKDKYDVAERWIVLLEHEWGGMAEEVEITVTETMDKGLNKKETQSLHDYHNR